MSEIKFELTRHGKESQIFCFFYAFKILITIIKSFSYLSILVSDNNFFPNIFVLILTCSESLMDIILVANFSQLENDAK